MPDFASPYCYIHTTTVYGIKKKKENHPVCERERVSERVSERGEWEWDSHCVADSDCVSERVKWRVTDRQTDR